MKNVYLISSLGMSPGVVTGVIDALQYGDLDELYNPLYIAVITTDNDLTKKSLEVIKRDIEQYNPSIEVLDYIIHGLSDINSREDNYAVMRTFITAVMEGISLKSKKKVDEIHVNIAGGRKTMSGVFTALSNLFPIDRVYHLITTPEMERRGYIKNFLDDNGNLDDSILMSKDLKNNLHPKLANEDSFLVEIPILSTLNFNELVEITRLIRERKPVPDDVIIEILLNRNFIRKKGDYYVFTKKGNVILKMVSDFIKD
ncbi:MAG: CRISPR-associated ring nuclease [Promethearchaeota archaeon]